MTENNHHDSAALDKLTEPFTVLPNDNPASDAKRQELIDKPAFGQVFSDNMAHMSWTKGEGWGDRRIEPYAPLKLDPGASVGADIAPPAPQQRPAIFRAFIFHTHSPFAALASISPAHYGRNFELLDIPPRPRLG